MCSKREPFAHMSNAWSCLQLLFIYLFSARSQYMDSGTKLTAKDATDAKTPAKSMSLPHECHGRWPGTGSGQKY